MPSQPSKSKETHADEEDHSQEDNDEDSDEDGEEEEADDDGDETEQAYTPNSRVIERTLVYCERCKKGPIQLKTLKYTHVCRQTFDTDERIRQAQAECQRRQQRQRLQVMNRAIP